MMELPIIDSTELEGRAESSEAGDAQVPEEPEEEEDYFSIATHRCQTVSDWQERFCDREFVQEITVVCSVGEVKPRGNMEIFKCYSAKCQICLDLNKDMFGVNVFTMLQTICDSAAGGCGTCDVLLQGIQKWAEVVVFGDEDRDEDQALSPFTIVNIGLQDGGPVSTKLSNPIQSWEGFNFGEYYASLQFYTPTGRDPPWPAFGFGRQLSLTLSVEECVSFAKEQVKNCDGHDASCKPSRPTQCPSRALDLGLGDTHGTIKLIEYTANLGPYITLSHCWGTTHSIVTTTTSNHQERVRSILETDLPKTFLDAVHITRGLGVRYLWIDSLCIIQDDQADWEVESTKMADVYSGAFLTIAATKAPNCDGGCLSDRVTQAARPLETFTINGSDKGTPFQVLVREALTIAHDDTCFSSPRSQTAPLFQRAWCFQERLLSPRLLHFHPDEMIWVCRSSTACECGHMQTLPPDSSQVLREEVRLLNQTFGEIDQGEIDAGEVWRIWKTIAELYPQLSITKESDRLPAMSGIATRLASVLQGSYLAGIWEESIPVGLAWLTDPQASRRRQNIPGVPSWSWMSLQVSGGIPPISLGEVFYNETFTSDSRFKLVKSDNTPATRNPFGPLLSPAIIIEGACIRRVYHFDPTDFFFPCVLQVDDEEHPFYADAKPEDVPSSSTTPAELVEGDKLLCLLLGAKGKKIAPEHMIGTDDGLQDMALVLKQNSDRIYQRVGLLVDYLRKKWFSGPVEVKRVVVV